MPWAGLQCHGACGLGQITHHRDLGTRGSVLQALATAVMGCCIIPCDTCAAFGAWGGQGARCQELHLCSRLAFYQRVCCVFEEMPLRNGTAMRL